MNDPVLQEVPLGFQWPTIDPFLFCVHHLDMYPKGAAHFGPDASELEGREIGNDFEPRDGWRMYHGSEVPGFPHHPHRGFETVTIVRQGLIDHSDSLGAIARFGRGDTQWLTAGSGIVHSEMFPLVESGAPNPTELFQIWLNLPATDKMVEPYFTMLWASDIPVIEFPGGSVTVVAGAIGDAKPPSPPPNSWAARDDAEVAIWMVRLDAGGSWTMPKTRHADIVRSVYFYEGDTMTIGDHEIAVSTGAVVDNTSDVELRAGNASIECLILQGRPIAEPVAQYGPFVMNTRAEIEQAFDDYQRTGFGGWPWDDDGPVHGEDDRFARHPGGFVERPG
ncbi:MAG TPA: pirin family protein [Ilumatobacteraceae bacterium]|nr:pirin family protein [Ilumatobacteraceae bacterium]